MKCTIPEISWHNREPVLSVDICPISDYFYKLASGGGDSHILIWQMILCENGSVKQEVVSDLTRHQRSVNTVRWSSTGQYLASADDDANIIVWQLKTDNIPLLEGNTEDKEVWIVYKVLRGHKEDIYDLCWSPDNLKLLSGSVDNTAIIWDLTKGKLDQIMTDHKGFVQGVAWDPDNQLVATISTDRICRIFDKTGRQIKARIHKGKLPVPSDHFIHDKESKYFHDDTFKSFFRRLQFSPDGSFLIVPSGYFQADDCKKNLNSTLIFTMDNWTEPVAVLPHEKQSSTVVRCCPLLFQHREDGPEPVVRLPYRIIFAIGTDHDIILYDTQQTKPFARFHEIHYTRITDLTWSKDGLLLIASSTDGFCSLITFEPNELGKQYIKEESDEESNAVGVVETVEATEKDENVDISNKTINEKEEAKKRPSFLVQWAQNTPKKAKIEKNSKDNGVIEIADDDVEGINILTPRRIIPQKIDENKVNHESKSEEKEINNINMLTPRRITPKKIEDKIVKKSRKEGKSINGDKHLIENSDEDEDKLEELPKEIKEEINKLLPRRITPKKIGECSKNNTQAKPIEVRRKPKETDSSKDNLVPKPSEITTDCKEAQSIPVPVKRKLIQDKETDIRFKKVESKIDVEKSATESIQNSKKNQEIHIKPENINRTSDKIEECRNNLNKDDVVVILDEDGEDMSLKLGKDYKKLNKDESLSKHVVEDKNEENCNKIIKQKSVDLSDLKKIDRSKQKDKAVVNKKTPKSSKKEQSTLKSEKTELIGSISSSPTSSEQIIKYKDHPKVKVGSLVKKKLSTTQVKSNPLLDFLKKSGEKKRNKPATVKGNIYPTCIEEEAMDGFSKESVTKDLNSAGSSPDAKPLDEDCTEDFCLQLEDTQQKDCEKKVTHEAMDMDENINKLKNVSNVIEISDDSCSSPVKSKVDENLVQKKPRRVSLITLSSPKGKKKTETEKIVQE